MQVTLTFSILTLEDMTTADLLSRWSGSLKDRQELSGLVENPIWLTTNVDMLELDWNL